MDVNFAPRSSAPKNVPKRNHRLDVRNLNVVNLALNAPKVKFVNSQTNSTRMDVNCAPKLNAPKSVLQRHHQLDVSSLNVVNRVPSVPRDKSAN